jgi:hypothetical protein
MENSHAVEKSRVSCTWIDEIRKSELFYSPEPLKGSCLKDIPKHTLNLRPLDVKLDEVV